MTDPRPWMALNSVSGVGRVLFKRLIARFGGPEAAFGASVSDLNSVEGLRPAVAEAIKSFDGWEKVDIELDKAAKSGARVVALADPEYPALLREIHDPPPCLYVKGALISYDKFAVAVVGTRIPTPYGRHITRKITKDLAMKGLTIVSGGARGIDTEAHRGALSARGRTVAVLGCGIDVVYPPENKELFGLIAEGGALVTEYPMGVKPDPTNFPPRNRIISGMSMGVVVVEAAGDSGSLITATYGLEQGREIFAVPGSVTSDVSRGTNSLIKKGARLIEGAGDIIADLFPNLKGYLGEFEKEAQAPEPPALDLGPDEKTLFEHISLEPAHIDTLVTSSGMAASKALSLLLGMEIKGVVKQMSGMRFVRGI